jgi:hypothetical protein
MFVLLCLFVRQPRKAGGEEENTTEVKKEVEENTIENTEEVENTIENTIENTLCRCRAEILWQEVLNTLETCGTSEIFQNTIENLRLEIVHCQNICRNHTIENTEEVENTIEEVENTIEEVDYESESESEWEWENTIEEVENTMDPEWTPMAFDIEPPSSRASPPWCRGGLHPPQNWWTGIEAWNAWAN